MQEVDTDFEIVGEVDSIFDGVEWFRTHPMPGWCLWTFIWPMVQPSISVRRQTSHAPSSLVTAYDEYALRAFKVNGVAYLLKAHQPD